MRESNTTSAVLDSMAVKADITYAMSAFLVMASSTRYRVGDAFVSASLPPYNVGDAEMQEGMSCLQDVSPYIQE